MHAGLLAFLLLLLDVALRGFALSRTPRIRGGWFGLEMSIAFEGGLSSSSVEHLRFTTFIQRRT